MSKPSEPAERAERKVITPGLQADDAELARYAMLLDCLGVGLLVYGRDVEVCLSNTSATAMLNNGLAAFTDQSGLAQSEEKRPAALVLRTGVPIQNCIYGINDAGTANRWINANLLPVLSSDGSIRRVLMTMTDISEIHWLEARLEQLSVRDPLTDAFNQRHTLRLLDEECHRSRRYGTPSTIALIDIDGLGRINTTHGRATGDRLLASIASRLRDALREIDVVGYHGNGQFLLILPNVQLDGAMIPLERIRAGIETDDFGNPGLNVTISGGVTECAGDTPIALIERAHDLLLQAKTAGRNWLCQDESLF